MQESSRLILEDLQEFITSWVVPEESYNCDIHQASPNLNILFVEHIIKKWDDEWLVYEHGIIIEGDQIVIADIYGHQSISLTDPASYNKIGSIIMGMQCLKNLK